MFNKGDYEHKRIISKILNIGVLDKNPRPRYEDGKPAYTFSYNGEFSQYDLSKGELPITTLRYTATKSAAGELLWIYQDASNDLDLLRDKYNITWWDPWDIGNRTIGQVYGATVKRYDLMNNLLNGIKSNPDGRRHIMSLWQEADFREPHGLKPCCYLTTFNVRHARDGVDYLDMSLKQRSSDYITAGCINQIQYCILQCLVAKHCGYEPGIFTWQVDNIQIYDRHVDFATELLSREPIECAPKIWINPDKKDFYDMTIDDIKIIDYPMDKIKKINPNVKLELGI